jgi:chemotaxis protein methyltransferase CheR
MNRTKTSAVRASHPNLYKSAFAAGADAEAIQRFRLIIARRLGLQFDDSKASALAEVLDERLRTRRLDQAADYLKYLETSADELPALASRLTVAETYFFRLPDHFRALVEVVLPQRLKAGGPLRFLSAGCATGEEPYSIVMSLLDHVGFRTGHASVRGIDANPVALAQAKAARYSAWSFRETPAEIRQRYFRSHGKSYQLAEPVRALVSFETGNLVDANAAFWQPYAYDAIFLRNVLMYFTPQAAQAVIASAARSLLPGGYLFLGAAESLRGLSQEFRLCHTHGAFYYQRRDGALVRPTTGPAVLERFSSAGPETLTTAGLEAGATSETGAAVDWQENIRKAAQHIETLSAASTPTSAPPPWNTGLPQKADPHAPHLGVGAALELLKEERFGEALTAMGAVPNLHDDSDAQLLRAVLLLNAGEFAAAEKACVQLLQADELNAGAHYVMALCREHNGDCSGAAEQDETAVYLDPAFAMARLHLGRLAKKSGDWAAARRELSQAAVLLAREDSSRILLFGGGFRRESLVALCRAELLSCGGAE